MAPVPETARQTWVLTGSPENFAATRDHDFGVIGLKERRRAFAEQIVPGDRIVLYVTKVMAFGASIRVTGELFEDRAALRGLAEPFMAQFGDRELQLLDQKRPMVSLRLGSRARSAQLGGLLPRSVPRSAGVATSCSDRGR